MVPTVAEFGSADTLLALRTTSSGTNGAIINNKAIMQLITRIIDLVWIDVWLHSWIFLSNLPL
jgi:hypothetical protein